MGSSTVDRSRSARNREREEQRSADERPRSALTATNANRFALRLARMVTRRSKVLVSIGATTGASTRR